MGNKFFRQGTSSGNSGAESESNVDQIGLTEANRGLNGQLSHADNNYAVGSKIKFDVLNKGVPDVQLN
jgi:hypothetical protein